MKLYLYIIFAIIFAILQTSLLTGFSSVFLRLSLSALVALCLLRKHKGTIYFAIISGFILDIYSASFFGTHIIIFLIIYFLNSLLLETIFTERGTMTTFLLSISSTVLFFVLSILISYLTKLLGVAPMIPTLSVSLLIKIVVSSLLNFGLVFILFSFFNFTDELFLKKAYRKKISF